ncbi:MAG: HemK2/MTQ2 family protein methyltransferase [Candidatus Aenigmatarchaeota archaeon]
MPQTDDLIRELRSKGDREVCFNDIRLKVFKEVWFYLDSKFLAENLNIPKDSFVLDMGTGTGLQAVIASKNAKKIIATDISNDAIKCAKENIDRLNLNKKIEVRKSNLFQRITEKFDVVIFNIPFNQMKDPKDSLEIAAYDKDSKLLKRFFDGVENHLKLKGKIILLYASFGNINILYDLIKKHKFRYSVIKTVKIKNDDFYIFEIFY